MDSAAVDGLWVGSGADKSQAVKASKLSSEQLQALSDRQTSAGEVHYDDGDIFDLCDMDDDDKPVSYADAADTALDDDDDLFSLVDDHPAETQHSFDPHLNPFSKGSAPSSPVQLPCPVCEIIYPREIIT